MAEQKKEYTRADCERYASLYKPIIDLVDAFLDRFDFELAEKMLDGMDDQAGWAEAGSILAGVDGHLKAEAMKLTGKTTRAIFNVFKARQAQKCHQINMMNEAAGRESAARLLGF